MGAICHDLDHFGLGNSYFVKLGHPLAKVVNNQSVMENYHIKMALNLIEKHNLFGSLSVVQAARAKKAIVEIIIPTDISKHFALQAQFESKQGRFDLKSEEDKNLLMAAYLHTCDLANTFLPFAHFRRWGVRVVQEMQDLYDSESALPNSAEFPALPFLKYKDQKGFCFGQVKFAKDFVIPLL